MPIKVEKLNNHKVMAIKITPNVPKWYSIAFCNKSIPTSPFVRLVGVRSIIIAVQLQIISVSIKTPNACVNPTLTGLSETAAAAAQGAEPEPASLEKSPRLIPFMRTAPKPPPAT